MFFIVAEISIVLFSVIAYRVGKQKAKDEYSNAVIIFLRKCNMTESELSKDYLKGIMDYDNFMFEHFYKGISTLAKY